MPFQNYQQLTEEISDLIARGGIGPKIPGWIDMAQSEIVQACRDLDDIVYKTTGTLSGAELTLPDDLISIETLQIDIDPIQVLKSLALPELKRKQSFRLASNESTPVWYARIGSQKIEMYPVPQNPDGFTLFYKGVLPTTDAKSTTSQLLAQSPQLLLYGAASHSSPYARDGRGPEWDSIYHRHLRTYRKFLGRTYQKTIQVSGYGAEMNDGPTGSYVR